MTGMNMPHQFSGETNYYKYEAFNDDFPSLKVSLKKNKNENKTEYIYMLVGFFYGLFKYNAHYKK